MYLLYDELYSRMFSLLDIFTQRFIYSKIYLLKDIFTPSCIYSRMYLIQHIIAQRCLYIPGYIHSKAGLFPLTRIRMETEDGKDIFYCSRIYLLQAGAPGGSSSNSRFLLNPGLYLIQPFDISSLNR